MKQAPARCVACGKEGVSDIWNGLPVLICSDCGLAWRVSFDLPDDYYKKLNDDSADPDDGKTSARLRNARDRLASVGRFLSVSGTCDIGCGDGSFLAALKEKGYAGWGIEPSAYACNLAEAKGIDVVHGELADLGIAHEGESAHAVTLFHVIEHLDDPVGALRSIADALPSGGTLVIETPDSDAAIQKVTGRKNALVYPEHLFYWNERSLRRVLENVGFKTLRATHRSFDALNAPIRASLLRLGLVRQKETAATASVKQWPAASSVARREQSSRVRSALRVFLAALVHLLGKDDYLLVVARKV